MIKLEGDLEDLHSVDPYLIQPLEPPTLDDLLTERNSESNSSTPQEFPDEAQLPQDCNELRMEHCINLDLYLTPIRDTMSNCFTDELNTPDIFEASKELNKIINTTAHQKQSDGNPFNFPATKQMEDEVESNNSQQRIQNQTNSSIMNLNTMMNNFAMNLNNSTMVEPISHLDNDSSTLLSPNTFDDINLDEYDFLNDYTDAILNDTNNVVINHNNDTQCDNSNAGEDNNQPTNVKAINEQHNYALKLNIGGKLFETEDLQTPDVINTICSIENDFTFFQGQYVSPEQIKQELAASPHNSEASPLIEVEQPESPEETLMVQDESSIQSSVASPAPPPTKRGRRRKYETDDEDYVPPTVSAAKRSKKTRRRSIKVESSDDEDDDGNYTPAKIPKRGRPSKPVSRASDSSGCSKYREMRDKNNEASRRSRRKRRVQEQTFEVECEGLISHNERLRVQVAELEKSVSTYRNNLMTILLHKK